jgi:hypothetical protein
MWQGPGPGNCVVGMVTPDFFDDVPDSVEIVFVLFVHGQTNLRGGPLVPEPKHRLTSRRFAMTMATKRSLHAEVADRSVQPPAPSWGLHATTPSVRARTSGDARQVATAS